MPLDIVHGLEAGFFSYITKPFRVQEFLNVLDLALAFASKLAMAVPK
jgi:DNA-binding response OmpR family regulator